MGEFLADFLNSSSAWFFQATDGQTSLYWNDADGTRHVARKVKNFDKASMKHTSEWVYFGEAPAKEEKDVNPALVEAVRKELDKA